MHKMNPIIQNRSRVIPKIQPQKIMTNRFKLLFCFLSIALLFVSCRGRDSKPLDAYTDVSYEEEYDDDDGTIVVPFQVRNGVKTIFVKLNGVGVDMIFDTGSSLTLISLAEARYLAEKGLLTDNDILGVEQFMIADGSIVVNMVVNLSEVIIADQIVCRNVKATVANNIEAPLLLGNDVLNRVASYTIDNEKGVINFQLK